jgi:hypothetical protein
MPAWAALRCKSVGLAYEGSNPSPATPFGVDGDHAFQMLVRSSQDTNIKLADVARWLTTSAGRQQARADGEATPTGRYRGLTRSGTTAALAVSGRSGADPRPRSIQTVGVGSAHGLSRDRVGCGIEGGQGPYARPGGGGRCAAPSALLDTELLS